MRRLLLLILDGWGINPETTHNPIAEVNPPFWNSLLKKFPSASLNASEAAVGVPRGCLSNSEIGHTAIGAGRVVPQSAFAIDRAIESDTFADNPVLTEAREHLKQHGSTLHLVGMLSSGGVHSHINHLFALITWAKKIKAERVALHLLLDGRDMQPRSAIPLLENLEKHLDQRMRISTVCGRAIGMDRTENWERTAEYYAALVSKDFACEKNKSVTSYILDHYADSVTDEFIPPARFSDTVIQDHDAVIFFNFRADRMRQLVRLFTNRAPHAIQKDVWIPQHLFFASMADYDDSFSEVGVLFPKVIPVNNLGEWVSKQGAAQLRITETEKYAHVTYFINGGQEVRYPHEERLVIPSLGLKNYASQPQMSLPEVTTSLIRALERQHFDLIICNIANPDMVGHSGDFHAALRAVGHVDQALSEIVPAAQKHNYTVMITADHGNIEHMHDGDQPHTAHTFNRVPILVTDPEVRLSDGELNQVAPTVLELMGFPKPPEMTSGSLVI